MTTPTDKLIETYFSPEATDLKRRSSRALKIGMAAGFSAMASFAALAVLIFLSVLRLNPLGTTTSVLIGVFFAMLILGLIPTSWIFIGRSAYLRLQLKKHIENVMTTKSV